MEKGLVLTGARVRFSLDGQLIGYARSISINEDIQRDPVETLDNIEVAEYVPIGYRVSFTASRVRLVGSTLKSMGLFPKAGANKDEHLLNILNNGSMVAQLDDVKTNRTIATLEQCDVSNQSFTYDARSISSHEMTFTAIRLRDESE